MEAWALQTWVVFVLLAAMLKGDVYETFTCYL